MNKRQFLATAALGVAGLSSNAQARKTEKSAPGPTLLTITGAIGPGNRGALDPTLDQMMHKQKIAFDRAYVFSFAELTALPAVSIKPTLEYDAKPRQLSGPLLSDVLKTAGARVADTTTLTLRAVDGYTVSISVSDARKYRFIVATHIENRPMPLGGLGPLWAVYDADRYPDMSAKPLNARFVLCPWALYHIDVQAA